MNPWKQLVNEIFGSVPKTGYSYILKKFVKDIGPLIRPELPMKDTDKMPTGKYKGQLMGNVHEAYFKWLCPQIDLKAPNKRSLAEKEVLKYAINKFGNGITK